MINRKLTFLNLTKQNKKFQLIKYEDLLLFVCFYIIGNLISLDLGVLV